VRLLAMLVLVEAAIMVPVWYVLRACRGQARPLWNFITRRES
jgi:hypothetical protein